jgi:tetratricopeptide (TPR) repeat protein
MGHLRQAQQRYDEAEPYFKKAFALHDDDQNAPENAAALDNLGILYVQQKKYDLAREYAGRSIAIYQKDFKNAGVANPGARQVYGRAIATQSWNLSKLAWLQNQTAEAATLCRTVLDFKAYLDSRDGDLVSACQQMVSSPKN